VQPRREEDGRPLCSNKIELGRFSSDSRLLRRKNLEFVVFQTDFDRSLPEEGMPVFINSEKELVGKFTPQGNSLTHFNGTDQYRPIEELRNYFDPFFHRPIELAFRRVFAFSHDSGCHCSVIWVIRVDAHAGQ
jgi:hypothetical protein